MKKLLLLVGLVLICYTGFSQVGIGNTNPDSSSLLDITATDKGILIPRVSLIDVTNVVSPVNNPTESLLVYNTNSSVTGGTGIGFYYFNGTSWEKITSTDSAPSVNLKDIGVISAFPGATYPNDMFLPISGGTFNDADYPEFANFISNLDSDVVTNNGNGTFTLANWNNNGIFLRSIGGNAGSIGALQQDATALPNSSFLTVSQSVLTNTDGSHTHSISTKQDNWDVSGGPPSGGPSFGIDNGVLAPRLDTDPAGDHNHNVTIPALNVTGGDIETRPINRSITWVIKVKPSASSVSNLTINNITDIGTDDQNIAGSGLVGTNLTIGIENGSSQVIDLSSLQDGTGTDNQNLTGATLTGTSLQIDIENGTSTTVNLATLQDGTGTDSQTIDTFSFNTGSNVLTLEVENDGVAPQTVNLSSLQDGTGTDNQNISGSGLAGTNLTIGIQNGTSQIVDLSSLQDGTGTDSQTIDTFSFNSGTNILTLEVENDGVAAQTVNLSSLQDGTGTDDQNITGATLTGTSLQIDIENGNSATVNLASLQDGTGTDDQSIDTFSFNSGTNILTLEVENDGVAAQTVNLSSLQDGTGTDNQTIDTFSFNSGTNILTLEVENDGVAAQTVDLSSLQGGNTLDQAYDEGGPGAGSTIYAYDGAVTIGGQDGLLVTGSYNNGDTAISGSGIRMFFNPRKAAFRTGGVTGNQWNDTNLGVYSTGLGRNSEASGAYSTAIGQLSKAAGSNSIAIGSSTSANANYSFSIGYDAVANGEYSTVMGISTNSSSYSEFVIGRYNTMLGGNASSWNVNDPLFMVGNGINTSNRSNALTIYKNGLMNINDSYNMPLTDGTTNQLMQTDGVGNVNWVNPTLNNLDQAYDQGGAGAGKTITADSGAVIIEGTDGFQVTGAFNSGANITLSGSGTRMLFNPNKAAFRAGHVTGIQWDDANVGNYSTALGSNTTASGGNSTALGVGTTASGIGSTAMGYEATASGDYSTVMGYDTTASGDYSIVMGYGTTASGITSTALGAGTTASGTGSTAMGESTTASGYFSTTMGKFVTAPSYTETSIGYYNTNYTPLSTTGFNSADKLFVIGNGINNSNRSNALTIYKNGLMNINDEYNMPLTDGAANFIMQTNGAGQVSFVDPNLLNNPNTLDQAYDQGGAGIGRTINTTDGAVLLNGADGLEIRGASADLVISNSSETESGIHFRDSGNTAQYADINYNNSNNLLNFYVSSATSTMTLDNNQRVGIGISPPAYKLDVRDNQATNFVAQIYNTNNSINGDGLKIRLERNNINTGNIYVGFYSFGDNLKGSITGNGSGNISYNTTSDRRLKTNIVNINNALNLIDNIQPRKYEFKANRGVIEYGFIAQELQAIYPQAVKGNPDSNVETDPMMVDYSKLTPLLTAGIKELKKEVEALSEKNKKQETEITTLKEMLSTYQALEARLTTLESNNLISHNKNNNIVVKKE